jgi:hypothetical protein
MSSDEAKDIEIQRVNCSRCFIWSKVLVKFIKHSLTTVDDVIISDIQRFGIVLSIFASDLALVNK